MPSGRTWIAVGVILVTVVLCYWRALEAEFAYDDKDLVVGNDYLLGWMAGAPGADGRPVAHLKEMLTADFAVIANRQGDPRAAPPLNYYRPIVALSYIVDTGLWAEAPQWGVDAPADRAKLGWRRINPFGFHLSNVLFHALNALLVFCLGRALTRSHLAGLLAGILFACHPIHTETVTWIAGRVDTVPTAGFLAALWAYVRYRNSGSRRALVAAMALFTISTFGKECVLPLPFVLMLYEVGLWLRDGRPRGKLLAGLGPAFVFLALAVPYFITKKAFAPSALPPGGDHWRGVPFADVLFTLPQAFAWYLGKLVYPLPLNIYPILKFVSPGAVLFWLPFVAVHVALLAGGVWGFVKLPRWRVAFFSVLGIYLCLLPYNCLLPGLRLIRFMVDVDFPVAERYLYVPSAFLALGGGLVLARLLAAGGAVRYLAGVLLVLGVVASVWISDRRNRDWSSDLTLYRSAVTVTPESLRMRNNYGWALMDTAWQLREGRRHLERGERQALDETGEPVPPEFFHALARNHSLRGEIELAALYHRRKHDALPPDPTLSANLGARLTVFAAITRNNDLLVDAVAAYQRTLSLAPGHPIAGNGLGMVRALPGLWRRARTANLPGVPGPLPDALVLSLVASCLQTAEIVADSEDVASAMQTLWVLDAGLKDLPALETMKKQGEGRQARRALVDFFRRQWDATRARCEGLRSRFPERPAVKFLVAEIERMGGTWLGDTPRLARARQLFEEVLAAEPDHAAAASALVGLFRRAGEADAATARIRGTIDALLGDAIPWEGVQLPAQPDVAVSLLDRVAADDGWPTDVVEPTWQRALALRQRWASERRGGESWRAWNDLGALEVRRASMGPRPRLAARAVEHLRKATHLAPRVVEPHRNLAGALRLAGRAGEARKIEQRIAAGLRPEFPGAGH